VTGAAAGAVLGAWAANLLLSANGLPAASGLAGILRQGASGGVWWWAALIAARIGMLAIAAALGAKAAGSVDAVFLVLGINRLAQSAMIGLRASRAGLPLGGPASRPAFTDGL